MDYPRSPRLRGPGWWAPAAIVGGLLVVAGSWSPVRADPPPARTISPASYAGQVDEAAYVPTSVGDTVQIDLCFPAVHAGDTQPAPGPFDVVVEYSYTTGSGPTSCSGTFATLVQHGYVAGYVSAPGTGGSNGGPVDLGSKKTWQALYDATQWLGTQAWSTGRVGGTGASGDGVLTLGVATMAPPALKAIIPQVTTVNGIESLWPGGMEAMATPIVGCAAVNLGEFAQNGAYTPPGGQDDVNRMLAIQEGKIGQTPFENSSSCPVVADYAKHGTFDSYWQTGRDPIENIKIPVWVMGAWDDITDPTTTELYSQHIDSNKDDLGFAPYLSAGGSDPLKTNNMLSMGYVSHAGGVPTSIFDPATEELRFFDQWIRGIDTGIQQDLKDKRFRYVNYEEWVPRYASTYPIPGTEYTPMYLSLGSSSPLASGSLTSAPPTQSMSAAYVYSPDQGTQGAFSGAVREHNQTDPANRDIIAYNDPTGRGDQRLGDPGSRVVFLSDPVSRDTAITGRITMSFYASTTATDTDFVAKVVDVWPDGTTVSTSTPQPGFWSFVTGGHLKGTFRSWKNDYYPQYDTPIPAGQVVKYDVLLDPTGWEIKQGHRIGVILTSSDVPYTFPNPNPAVVTIYSSPQYPSHLTVPIVPESASNVDTGDGLPAQTPGSASSGQTSSGH